MTPLQQAAQQALEAITIASLRCVSEAETCKVLAANVALRKALAAEQAQAVEPAAWISITQHGSTTTIDNTFNDCVSNWPVGEYKLYTHPAPPPAGEHVPETAFGNTERSALIARLRLGASISRARRINEDFAAIAEDYPTYGEADGKAQQVAAPVTKTRVGNYLCRHESGDNTMFRNGFKDGVKFAEAHHGITEKPPHTDWSAA